MIDSRLAELQKITQQQFALLCAEFPELKHRGLTLFLGSHYAHPDSGILMLGLNPGQDKPLPEDYGLQRRNCLLGDPADRVDCSPSANPGTLYFGVLLSQLGLTVLPLLESNVVCRKSARGEGRSWGDPGLGILLSAPAGVFGLATQAVRTGIYVAPERCGAGGADPLGGRPCEGELRGSDRPQRPGCSPLVHRTGPSACRRHVQLMGAYTVVTGLPLAVAINSVAMGLDLPGVHVDQDPSEEM